MKKDADDVTSHVNPHTAPGPLPSLSTRPPFRGDAPYDTAPLIATSAAQERAKVDRLSIFGLIAVSLMLVTYALEARSHWFTLLFAGSCALGSTYGFLQGAWPFGPRGGRVGDCGPGEVAQDDDGSRRHAVTHSGQQPQRRPVPLADFLRHATPHASTHRRTDLVPDGDGKPPIVRVPALGRDDVPGELAGVQGLRGRLQGRLAQGEHVRPAYGFRGAMVDRGGPVYGRGVEQADRRGDVEEIGPSLA